MREFASWRHLLALAITAAAAGLLWNGTRLSLDPPAKPARPPVMHVTLTRPPAPEAPPPPKPAPPPPMKAAASSKPLPQAIAPPVPAVDAPNADAAAGAPALSQSTAAEAAASPAPAAPPAAPAPSAPSGDASLEAAYFARVRAAIEEQKHYPMSKDARLQQPKGTVVVWFVLNRAGALQDSGIQQSGGSILDRAAIESVHRTVYPPIPDNSWPGQERHRFSADLRFTPP